MYLTFFSGENLQNFVSVPRVSRRESLRGAGSSRKKLFFYGWWKKRNLTTRSSVKRIRNSKSESEYFLLVVFSMSKEFYGRSLTLSDFSGKPSGNLPTHRNLTLMNPQRWLRRNVLSEKWKLCDFLPTKPFFQQIPSRASEGSWAVESGI